jgi:hypothetical protein
LKLGSSPCISNLKKNGGGEYIYPSNYQQICNSPPPPNVSIFAMSPQSAIDVAMSHFANQIDKNAHDKKLEKKMKKKRQKESNFLFFDK